MKPLAFVAFALLMAGLQAAVLRWIGGGAYPLALLATCVVYVGLHGGNVEGSIGAAGVGYLMDLMAGTPKGLMTFLAVLLFLIVRAVSATVDLRTRSAFALLSAVSTLFLSMCATILLRNVGAPEAAPSAALFPRMLLEALLTGAASPAVLVALRRIDALFHREEPGLIR